MAMEITNNYQMYAVQNMAESGAASNTKKKETEKTQETAGNSRTKSTAEYANELSKLVPSVEFKVGNSFSTAKNGITLTINPQLLEKMQNDSETEKEMKELIKGVESMTKLMDGIYKASGWTVVYRHSYIDENGKYSAMACVRNDFMLDLSDKLREERKENAEEFIEEIKEESVVKTEELQELLEEKITEEEEEEKEIEDKAEKLLYEKMAASKDGLLYLDDVDLRTILAAMREKEEEEKNAKKEDESLDPQKLWERNRITGREIADKSMIKQAANSLSARNYNGALAGEMKRLSDQRQEGDTYGIANRTEDAVRAYANLYDEIVREYQNGTRERYVEDENAASGFRKMTMEEELEGLGQAFQRLAKNADVKDMITGEFNRVSQKAANAYKKLQKPEQNPQESMGQKMKNLAQIWKEVYQVSGSKEKGMEEVLFMIYGGAAESIM